MPVSFLVSVRTALVPFHTSKPHDQENLDKKKGSCGAKVGLITNPNNKNPLPLQTEEKPTSETAGGLPFQAKEHSVS